MKNRTYIEITVALIIMMVFFIRGTVVSQSFQNEKEQHSYLAEIEKNHMIEVKALLEEKEIYHSGINFTSITEEDGKVGYTMVINHKKIRKLSKLQKDQLLVELDKISILDKGIIISHEFLVEF